jgi:hypothetical protein
MFHPHEEIGGVGRSATANRQGETFVDGESLQMDLHDGWDERLINRYLVYM